MRDLRVSWEDLLVIYANQTASSFEKTYGNDMLGEELCCLSFWLLEDTQHKGWFTLAEAGKLLRTFKFDNLFYNFNHDLIDE